MIHVGLLRAVNLGPHNKVSMSDLRQLLGTLGLRDVQTVLQSGNVVFRSGTASTGRLERLLEEAVETALRVKTDFFVRTASEWKSLIDGNPFPDDVKRDPGHVLVLFLKDAPDPAAVTSLRQAITGREVIETSGRHAYVVYRDGIGRSRLTNLLLEKKLGTRSTGRNWNTVLKLGALTSR
jgi:uncharacterized protein (DUF1697 family)